MCKGIGGQKCYRYVPTTDTWVVSGTLQQPHVKSGYTYHNEFGLVISGHSSGNRTSVENLSGNQTIQVPTCEETVVKYMTTKRELPKQILYCHTCGTCTR